MTAIVVGNGPIKNQGEYIDSFDNIIRIHDGINHLDPINVGEKTIIWATRLEAFSNPGYIKNFKEKNPDIEVWNFNQTSGELMTASNKASDKYGLWPTTGFLCVLRALERFKEVSAVGFGLVEKKQHHFWSDKAYKPGEGKKHDSIRELEIMESLGINFEKKSCLLHQALTTAEY